VILLSFLLGLAAVVAATVFCVVRGRQLWKQAKRTGGALSSEVAKFEERSARTERLLEEAERANEELQASLERLRVSRARLQVHLDALERARQRTRWLRAFLPVR
jgi:septal ring factor EnvC (AmiA/AmiB activator)